MFVTQGDLTPLLGDLMGEGKFGRTVITFLLFYEFLSTTIACPLAFA